MRQFLILVTLFQLHFLLAQSPITKVYIENVFTDSTLNCRALEISNGDYFFATSDGRVMKSTALGISAELIWPQDQLNSPNFRSLAIVNDNVFALGIGSPALLYKNGEIVYREDNVDAFYDSMEFWNEMEGIAMGDMVGGCMSIIITRDGGETWAKVPCEKLPDGVEGEGAFAASDTNLKLIGDHAWIATGGMVSRIFHSSDKGETWEVFESPVIQGTATTGMYSIDFYDLQTGFAVGGDYTSPEGNQGTKLKTTDGGQTWNLVANGKDPGYRSCVQFVPEGNAKQIILVGFNGIDVSNDGGESWKHLSDEDFYTLRFVDSREAYAAGKGRVSRLIFE
ncbi:WD40/YVTN/BNR-like repeat-containing protein [Portibacter marinus]|uniref:WD40/YVTN/BNR-like repeat-containing protein n=1 Tax=Portibacter marinus TaxID=2898660 RepID=UPI001F447DB7|nr:oxidoreductase [Portibacter marinus]